jgi:hypothetical protein
VIQTTLAFSLESKGEAMKKEEEWPNDILCSKIDAVYRAYRRSTPEFYAEGPSRKIALQKLSSKEYSLLCDVILHGARKV